MNVISVVMLYYPNMPDILQTIFVNPNIVLMNIMAGRVFTNTILYGDRRVSQITTSVVFQNM